MNNTLKKILMAPVKLVSLISPILTTGLGIYGGVALAASLGTMAIGLPIIGGAAGFIVGRAYFISAYGGIIGNDRTFGEALAETFTKPVKNLRYNMKELFNKKAQPETPAASATAPTNEAAAAPATKKTDAPAP